MKLRELIEIYGLIMLIIVFLLLPYAAFGESAPIPALNKNAGTDTYVCNGYLNVNATKIANGTLIVSYSDMDPGKTVSVSATNGEDTWTAEVPCTGRNVQLATGTTGTVQIVMSGKDGRTIGSMEFYVPEGKM